MNYTGYCVVHDLCTVFVFESSYKNRRDIAANMARTIEAEFAFTGASFDFECFTIASDDGQNVWQLAENAARDSVGQFAFCDSVPEYTLHDETICIAPAEKTLAQQAQREYGIPRNIAQALIDGLCAAYDAHDETEISAEFAALIKNMTEYYN